MNTQFPPPARVIEFHPHANIFGLIEGVEFDSLVESIHTHGLKNPIIMHTDGRILDGRNRYRACLAAIPPVEPKFIPWDGIGLSTDFVWLMNETRRHLDGGAKQIAAGRYTIARESEAKERSGARTDLKSIESDFGKSREKAAEKFGISHDTVSNAVKVLKTGAPELVKAVETEKVSVSAAANIATLPKAEQKQIVAMSEAEIIKAANKIKQDKKEQKQAERKAEVAAKAATVAPASERYALYQKPCAEIVNFGEDVFDWIITDPPYPKEFLPVYADLAMIAEKVLKPGGSLLCMIGQSYLPGIVKMLSERLIYHWTIAYLTPGGQATQLFPRHINTFWKPILWFTKGEYKGDWVGDVTKSDVNNNDKRFHHWGQSESGMADLMQRFVKPNDRVLDPFMGAGTTGAIALQLGAYFVGFDPDQNAFNESTVRLSGMSHAA